METVYFSFFHFSSTYLNDTNWLSRVLNYFFYDILCFFFFFLIQFWEPNFQGLLETIQVVEEIEII